MYTYDINAPAGNLHSSGKDRIYPDPFLSYSTMLMPKTIDETLRWCEHLWLRNGTYAQAMKRVVAYFLTKVEIIGAADQEKARFEELLNETMKVDVQLFYLGMDYMAYGNSFSSLIVPFKRMLRNPKTRTEIPIDRVDYEFKGGKFHWTDPKTNEAVVSEKPIDRRITTESEVGIKRWSPHQIKIQYHPVSGRKVYLWQPPADIIKKVKQGDKFILRDMPWEMVQAILDDKLFEFNPDIIYHMCEDALAGIDTAGWGISHMIPNFMQAYYIQMAKLYNEVLMNEYILPFRAVTPAKGNQGKTDPLISGNMGSFNSKILGMLKQHRRNPGGWHALPFPIEYQSLGGEGAQINTYDHIGAAMDELLNASGVPAEFYKGTISFQALPSALRLFQNSWPHLVSHFNGWLDWLMK